MERTVIAGIGIRPFGRFEKGHRELSAHAAPTPSAMPESTIRTSTSRSSETSELSVAHVDSLTARGAKRSIFRRTVRAH